MFLIQGLPNLKSMDGFEGTCTDQIKINIHIRYTARVPMKCIPLKEIKQNAPSHYLLYRPLCAS